MRLSPMQANILDAMRNGATLTHEGGVWVLSVPPPHNRPPADTCRRLVRRGLIVLAKTEEHQLYAGGKLETYVLPPEA